MAIFKIVVYGPRCEGVIDKRAGSLCITRTGEGMI